MEKCDKCNFPLNEKDVNENIYELHTVCECEETEMMIELYMEEQSKKTPEELARELEDWNKCAKYIQKKGISPNLDSIY